MHKQIEMKGKEMKKKKKPIDLLLFCFTLRFVITWFAINILLNEMMSGIGKPKRQHFNKDQKTKTSWLQMLSPQKYYKNQWKRNYIAEKKTQDMNRTNKKETNKCSSDSAIKRKWQKRAHAIFQYRSIEQTVIALCKNKSNKTRCENSYLFLSISFFSFNNLLDINSGRAMYGKRSIARSSDSRLVLFFALL